MSATPRPRAVLFDLDDTLLDWYAAVHASWEAVCAVAAPRLGADAASLRRAIQREGAIFWADEAAVAEYRVRPLDSRREIVRLALLSEGLDDAPAAELARRSLGELRERIAPFPDALGTLDALRAEGYRLALVTNGSADTQRAKIERWGLADRFEAIVVEGEFGRGKPDPAVFAHALEGAGAAPDEAWMVGDNLYADIGGAQAAGIHGVWIHRGRLAFPDDPPAWPERRIGHLAELRAALEAAPAP